MTTRTEPTQTAVPRSGPEPAERHAGRAWHLVIGLTLWMVWFGATYGGVAVACAVAPPPPEDGPFTWVNAAVLLLAAACASGFALTAWIGLRAVPHGTAGSGGQAEPTAAAQARERFITRCASALYAIAAVCTVAVALPAVLLAPCA